jgi:hypothetical protein
MRLLIDTSDWCIRSSKIGKIPQIVIKAAHYQSQRTLVIDPAISMLAAVYECQIILNS